MGNFCWLLKKEITGQNYFQVNLATICKVGQNGEDSHQQDQLEAFAIMKVSIG